MGKIEGLSILSAIPTVELIDDAYAFCEDETLKVIPISQSMPGI
jgi:hypothetical protein